jgi:cobalt transporter subunit CbtA
MMNRLLAGGLVAGFAAGLFAALLHFAFVQELILLGEEYETGALVHFAGAGQAAGEVATGHEHADGEVAEAHDHAGDAEVGTFERNALTVLFTGLIYAGYGLLLVAGYALADLLGRRVEARDGILWGVAGFAALQLAPAMGLAPELPGTVAADLGARQAWWFGTVVATGGGLALLAYGRGVIAWVIAGALLAAPHVIGAPHLDSYSGVAPPEVAGEFSARVLGVALVAWSVLGWLTARTWTKTRG